MEKHFCTSRFNIEGTGGEEETLVGNEDKEGERGNWTAADWQQDFETLHGSKPLEEEWGEVCPARKLRCLYTNSNSVINNMDELHDRIIINDLHIITSAGNSDRNVSVCPSVRPSRAGIVSKRRKLAA